MNSATNYDTWLTTDTTDTLDPCNSTTSPRFSAMRAAPVSVCIDCHKDRPEPRLTRCWDCNEARRDRTDSYMESEK